MYISYHFSAWTALILMIYGHYFADYPFQSQFMSDAKNRMKPIPGIPWNEVLIAHSMIHSFFVFAITQNGWLALGEYFAHFFIDEAKCRGLFGEGKNAFVIDQFIHLVCKFIWFGIYWEVS